MSDRGRARLRLTPLTVHGDSKTTKQPRRRFARSHRRVSPRQPIRRTRRRPRDAQVAGLSAWTGIFEPHPYFGVNTQARAAAFDDPAGLAQGERGEDQVV